MTATALRCDYQGAPLALAGGRPMFSWELAATADASRQTAYRVTVASSRHALESQPDLWDSGLIVSPATFGVAYAGVDLMPRQRCWWRVETVDEAGATALGPMATFETGQLETAWTAQWLAAHRGFESGLDSGPADGPVDSEAGFAGCRWVWPQGDPEGTSAALLEAEFDLESAEGMWVASAGVGPVRTAQPSTRVPRSGSSLLLIAVLGPFTLRLNGRVVDTGTYWRTPYFVELGPYLRRGRNRLTLSAPRTSVGPAGVVGRLYLPDATSRHERSDGIDVADLWRDATVLGVYGDPRWGRLRSITPPSTPPVMRRDFVLPETVVGLPARLYVSALGLYRARLNGELVGGSVGQPGGASEGEARLAPGWTDYAQRALYQSIDVSGQLRAGENAIEVELADGWYAGNVACVGRSVYGQRPALIAELWYGLESEHAACVATDEHWTVSTGPRRTADLLKGEWHDLTRASSAGSGHGPVEVVAGPRLVPQTAPSVGVIAEWKPVAVTRRPDSDRLVYDFGRNLVGVVRLRVAAADPLADAATGNPGSVEAHIETGRTISVRHAEMLDRHGELYTDSLRGATQLDALTLPPRHGDHTFEPAFTVHGFRYLELEGLGDPNGAPTTIAPDVTALEVGSRFVKTGDFRCSDDGLNRLVAVIERTVSSNYGVLPTDCPNRDERMGWLDVHALAPSALHLYDLATYYGSWLASMREAQYEDGVLPHVVPDVLAGGGGEAGWADCAVILPWHLYQRYGDRRVLAENYTMMCRWVDFLAQETDDHIRPATGFGDWLAAGEDTPKDLIGTAYFARSAEVLSRTAEVLGDADGAERYRCLRESVTRAFRKRFVGADGLIGTGSQTGYVLALDFDVLPVAARQSAAKRLADGIRRRGGLATGYMGVPRLLNVLSRFGEDQLALDIVRSRDYPGWGYMLDQGATTLWERWDSYRPEVGFADPAMNSFNHPSLCAVLEWLVGGLGGLSGAEPGFTRARFTAPRVAGVTSCEVGYRSMIGEYRTSWNASDRGLVVEARVPPNGALDVELQGETLTLGPGEHRLQVPGGGTT